MAEYYNLVARWKGRKESLADCAKSVSLCLQRLAQCDSVFAHTWYKCRNSRKKTLESKITTDLTLLAEILEKGRSKRDDARRSIIEELGYSSGTFWNGEEEDAVKISFRCGALSKVIPSPNDTIIDFPADGASAHRILTDKNLEKIMRVIVEVWRPDWARISTYPADLLLYPQPYYSGAKIGWLTYLAANGKSMPTLPSGFKATNIDAFGGLIVIETEGSKSLSNPAYVESLQKLSDLLNRSGMLL